MSGAKKKPLSDHFTSVNNTVKGLVSCKLVSIMDYTKKDNANLIQKSPRRSGCNTGLLLVPREMPNRLLYDLLSDALGLGCLLEAGWYISMKNKIWTT
jgi:hypothetical protein